MKAGAPAVAVGVRRRGRAVALGVGVVALEIALGAGVVERSIDEARNSMTILREWRTRSESVFTTMSGSTLRAQAGASTRAPSSSTTHTRQTFAGWRVSP